MDYIIRKYNEDDTKDVMNIINEIIKNGANFPWYDEFSEDKLRKALSAQSGVYVACVKGQVVGFYTYKPNGIDRCSHIANATYGVKKEYRGKGIGKALVSHSLIAAKESNFLGMQFNGVVSTNYAAKIYCSMGFEHIGTVNDGFRLKDNTYADSLIFYKKL